jgi:nanoRNase/pAp phosphatase (c-di-AMP/oligoRNAs hydrolase)
MPDPAQPPPFNLDQALAQLRGRKSMLIYMHDNPDPDALAAGLGLRHLMEHELGVVVTLAHGGIVGRAQNRAMVDNIKIALTPVERLEPDDFETIAMVDSQPETGNNSLPVGHRIDVVIDHHPPRSSSARAPWCDIRPELGATSTIVFEYLRQRNVPVDAPLATAFFFALRTETRDLGRESTDAERNAYLQLVPLVDHNLLYRMTHPKVSREHFAALDRALRSAQVYGDIVAVNLGTLGYPDLVAEIADLLLAYERARFVLCMGEYEGSAYLSLRTEASEARAGSMMRQVVGTDGAAGGHGTMAGARLFAPVRTEIALQAAFTDMVRRFCEILTYRDLKPEPLLRPPGPRIAKTFTGRPPPADPKPT